MIRTLAAATAVCLCLPFNSPASALDAPTIQAAELSHRIAIAGRQRMLLQRIGRASCFGLSGVDTDRHAKMAKKSMSRFEEVQKILRDGHAGQGYAPERDKKVLVYLDQVDRQWRTLGAAYRQMLAGDLPRVVVSQIVELTNPTVEAANGAVKALVSKGGRSTLSPQLAKTIDIAGRQRMLSQRAAKEFCLLNLGIEPSDNRQRLSRTIDLFERSLSDLEQGKNGIVAPPNAFVSIELRWVRLSWNEVAPLFKRAIDGEVLDREASTKVAELSDNVLEKMQAAVEAYTLPK